MNCKQSQHSRLCAHHFEHECFQHDDKGKVRLIPTAVPTIFSSPDRPQKGSQCPIERQRNMVGTEVSVNVDHAKASAVHDHTYCVRNVVEDADAGHSNITVMLHLHDDTRRVSDVGLRYNDITVRVDVSEESVASEVHDTGINDHVYAWTPLVPEKNYCRLLTSPGDVPTPQLSNEYQNPIPTNPRSIPVCLHFFSSLAWPLLIPCLYQRATWLTRVELQAASLGDVPTLQLSRGSNTTNHAADPQCSVSLVLTPSLPAVLYLPDCDPFTNLCLTPTLPTVQYLIHSALDYGPLPVFDLSFTFPVWVNKHL
nr:uncharacterized protein LOC111964057 [Salvelinus alpinus]XP_023843507.1 uncharacterized protein LOC111964057 [Salvelinus alpinus]